MRVLSSIFLVLFLACAAKADLIAVQGGAAGSNAWVGGRIYRDLTRYTNCCAAGLLTNLVSMTVSGHTLTNVGDTVSFVATGRYSTTGQAKRLIVTYGSENLLDTGLLNLSNGTYWVTGFIMAGAPQQYYAVTFRWDRATAGGGTNRSGYLSQTNGIPTLLRLQAGANVVSAITNECFIVDWSPSPPNEGAVGRHGRD